jgi:hypothetical protein
MISKSHSNFGKRWFGASAKRLPRYLAASIIRITPSDVCVSENAAVMGGSPLLYRVSSML